MYLIMYTLIHVYTNTWLPMHVHGCMYAYKQMLYYIMITKLTVAECNSPFLLLMYLLKVTNGNKSKSVLNSG